MYQINFKKPIHVHFIGIGGISMSGLADILLSEGFDVSGSDMKESELTEHLRAGGARIEIGQKAANIEKEQPEVVVYTAAIHPDNPELRAAMDAGIAVMPRAELLGELMSNYREAINVAGTHGKTTTTSMISEIMLAEQKDPTITVGGMLDSIGGNIRVGGPEIFVAEACEYTNSFLSFYPTTAVVLNVEADHLDFFKGIGEIRRSFRKFIFRLPQNEKGFLVINGDIRDLAYFTEGLGCPFVTFGKEDSNDYTAHEIRFGENACASYRLVFRGEEIGLVTLGVPGIHNVYNSLAAIAAAVHSGVDIHRAMEAVGQYAGTKRRFEKKGMRNGFTVVDDYAHHPQEIEATLRTAAMVPHRRLVVIFQPHTYSRTAALMNEFADALTHCDEVILPDIYAARETNTLGISSKDLADEIAKRGTKALYLYSFEKIEKYILETLGEEDLLITMGAGNVVDIGNRLVSEK